MNLLMNENLMFPTLLTVANSMPFTHRYVSIKFGPMILEARGSIGGVVVSRNAGGAYMRARTIPINPNTQRQVNVRSALAMLTARWSQTLTALQRTGWNLYASNVSMLNRLGESIFHSGFNHYIRSNTIMAIQEGTIVDAPPVIFELPAQDPVFRFTGSEATQQHSVVFDNTMDWADENDAYMFIFEGQPQNAQRNFFGGPHRFLGFVAGVNGAPPASPALFTTNYGIAELQHAWIYARIMRADGRLSEKFRDDSFIAA